MNINNKQLERQLMECLKSIKSNIEKLREKEIELESLIKQNKVTVCDEDINNLSSKLEEPIDKGLSMGDLLEIKIGMILDVVVLKDCFNNFYKDQIITLEKKGNNEFLVDEVVVMETADISNLFKIM